MYEHLTESPGPHHQSGGVTAPLPGPEGGYQCNARQSVARAVWRHTRQWPDMTTTKTKVNLKYELEDYDNGNKKSMIMDLKGLK